MKQAIIDYRSDKTIKNELEKLGVKTVYTVPVEKLYNEVKGHADMQLHIVNGKAICAPEVYEYYKENLYGLDIVKGSYQIGEKYPYDTAYNTCGFGDFAVCRKNSTVPEILNEYDKLGKIILNTKQGYSKCSICIVNKYSLITADEGIYRLLKTNNLNVLKIQPGFVELYNMSGFIGGASGLISNDLLAFCGSLTNHPDGLSIKAFCKDLKIDVIELNSGNLKDIGSIIVYDNESV